MKEIKHMLELFKKSFGFTSVIFMFPFTLIALVLCLPYLIFGCFYMLIDIFVQELRFELDRGNETAGFLAVGFKYFIVYSVYIVFMLQRICMKFIMAIIYFLTYLFIFVATLGRIKDTPFVFHKDYQN